MSESITRRTLLAGAAATGLATSMIAMGAGLIAGPLLAGAAAKVWGVDAVFLGCLPLTAAFAVLVRSSGSAPDRGRLAGTAPAPADPTLLRH